MHCENVVLDFPPQSLLLPVAVYIRIQEFRGKRCDLRVLYIYIYLTLLVLDTREKS